MKTSWRPVRLVVVALAVLGVSETARRSLNVDAAPYGHFVVTVTPAVDPSAPETPPPVDPLRVAYLVVDGRRVRVDELALRDGWQVVEMENFAPPTLRRTGGAARSVMEFDGRSFLLQLQGLPWRGVIRVWRDGVELSSEDLAGADESLLLEAPGTAPAWWVFGLALAGFGWLSWRLGVWRRGGRTVPWLTVMLSAFHGLFWATQAIGVEDDAPGYLESLAALRDGVPAYFPPGYPLLLGVTGWLAGDRAGLWVTLVQHAMTVAAAVWTYRILRRVIADDLALVGALIAGSLVPVLAASQTILSEAATLFAMIGACHFALRAAEERGRGASIASGLLLGWGGLLRVVPLGAIGPALLALHLRSSRRVRSVAITLTVAGATVGAPLAWNAVKSGQPRLTYSSGLHLFNRAVTEGDLVAADAPATRRLLSMVGEADPRSKEWWHVTTHPAFYSWREADVSTLLYHVSLESIRSDPVRFAAGIPPLAWREFVADAAEEDVPWATTRWESPLETSPVLRNTASGLRWREHMRAAHRAIWLPLCVLAILGAMVGYRVAPPPFVVAFTWVTLSYLLASASLDEFTARHNIELVPFVIVLAMLSLQAAVQWGTQLVTRIRAPLGSVATSPRHGAD